MVSTWNAVAAVLAGTMVFCSAGCGSRWPVGATLQGGPPPKSTYCVSGEVLVSRAPVKAHSFDAKLGIHKPGTPSKRLDGPFSAWHANGRLRAHGDFAIRNERSVANGIWSFWHEDGTLAVRGRYVFGGAVGCFGVSGQRGKRHTYAARGDSLVPVECNVPPHAVGSRLADRYTPTSEVKRPKFEVELGMMHAPTNLPVAANGPFPPFASSSTGPRVTMRRLFNRLHLGLAASYRYTQQRSLWSGSLAAVMGVHHRLNDRLSVAIGFELGARAYSSYAYFAEFYRARVQRFTTGYAGVDVGLSVWVNRSIAVSLGMLAQRDRTGTAELDGQVCEGIPPFQTCRIETARWRYGGSTIAAMLGVRFQIR